MKGMLVRQFRRNRRTTAHIRAIYLVLLCVVALVGAMFFRCRPIMLTYAESQAIWVATRVANQTAAQIFEEYSEQCANTIDVTYDDQQKVSSIKTDITTVNAVRTSITDAIIENFELSSRLYVSLPFGTLTGWHWFSGIGPLLTFPISYTAELNSTVSSTLTAEGINQSAYRVSLLFDISLYVVTPGGRTSVGTSISFPVAESIILGEVPDNLTEVYGDDQSLLGQIFDYGTNP